MAAQFKVEDGPNEEGKMFRRPARPSDRIVSRFPNKQAAQHANNGMYPPDLSLITKARRDGIDYLYAFLIGYGEAPAGFELNPGMHFNRFAPGQQTGMEAVLEDDLVEFDDGTPATADQMARDVTEFLAWAADPHREIRHSIGSRVVVFLFLLTMMLIALKREVWAHLHEKKPGSRRARRGPRDQPRDLRPASPRLDPLRCGRAALSRFRGRGRGRWPAPSSGWVRARPALRLIDRALSRRPRRRRGGASAPSPGCSRGSRARGRPPEPPG